MLKNQMQNDFWEAHIKNLPSDLEPTLTTLLFEHGCGGTTQNLEFSQPSLTYEAVIEETDRVSLISYFDITQKEEVAPWLQSWVWSYSPDTEIQWMLQKNRDWLTEWKKHFKPFKLSGINFVPIWLFNPRKYPRAKSVILEPGMAFGTGHHATTKFAIQNLRKLTEKKQLQKKDILDVGAGSGILAIVAEKLGARSVLAVDNDPHCWRESKKTFRLNKAKKSKTTTKQLAAVKQTFDVVIANIIDGILMQLKEDLWRVTRPEGYLLLSGILTVGADAFIKDFFENRNYLLVQRLEDPEWTCFLVQKK